jgi:hypothetical protein
MNIVKMILKEAGGRFQNAAGSIGSKDNMFELFITNILIHSYIIS